MHRHHSKIWMFALLLTAATATPVFAAISSGDVVDLVNRERTKAGIPALARSETLDRVAGGKADDMVREQYFSHTSPSGVTPWHWFRAEQYDYRYAGENLAIHFKNADTQHLAWMESKKHCENILSPKYAEIGVAVREAEWDGKPTVVAVQMFGTKMGDEEKLPVSTDTDSLCPKVLSGFTTGGGNESSEGLVGGLLRSITERWHIESGTFFALLFFGAAQAMGVMLVILIAFRSRRLSP